MEIIYHEKDGVVLTNRRIDLERIRRLENENAKLRRENDELRRSKSVGGVGIDFYPTKHRFDYWR
jgi:hypothetical protein